MLQQSYYFDKKLCMFHCHALPAAIWLVFRYIKRFICSALASHWNASNVAHTINFQLKCNRSRFVPLSHHPHCAAEANCRGRCRRLLNVN